MLIGFLKERMKKILAIDDKQDNLTAVSALLRALIKRCSVITAETGPLGIEKAIIEQPDVILLDIKMPDMDGYEVCRRLKSDERTAHIPVIMLTAIKTDADSRVKGLDMGADAFLSKPIDAAELAAQVNVMLRIKKAEDSLRQERDELKTRAKELENFAFTVSHDLKAPLLNLGGYSSLLMKRYGDRLDEQGRHYLEVLQRNVLRMEEFIGDLLELSRIGRVLGEQENADTGAIIAQVLDELKGKIKEKNVRVTLPESFPVTYLDSERIKQVFINLADNAVKFLGDRSDPELEIGYEDYDQNHYQFFVRDNGIGIDKANHEKIFQEFHRVNDVETEGTGIGLAIVKKIIEAHNCKIWLDSKKGAGSTFYFTLPKIVNGG